MRARGRCVLGTRRRLEARGERACRDELDPGGIGPSRERFERIERGRVRMTDRDRKTALRGNIQSLLQRSRDRRGRGVVIEEDVAAQGLSLIHI